MAMEVLFLNIGLSETVSRSLIVQANLSRVFERSCVKLVPREFFLEMECLKFYSTFSV